MLFLSAWKNVWQTIVAVTIAIAFSLSVFVGYAIAQDTPESIEQLSAETSAVPSVDTSTISSEKISQFATAYEEIIDIVHDYRDRIDSVETPEEADRLQSEIEAKANDIIQRSGLEPSEYFQLLGLANADAEFGERVVLQLEQK